MIKSLIALLLFTPFFALGQTEGKLREDSLKRQYHELVIQYEKGTITFAQMPALINAARELQQNDVARSVAQYYISAYLLQTAGTALYEPVNIAIIHDFNDTSGNKLFRMFYEDQHKIDQVMELPGYAQSHVDFVIAKEEIDPLLRKELTSGGNHPDWKFMETVIKQKYNSEYAMRTITGAQLRWYEYKKDTLNLIRYNLQRIDRYGIDTLGFQKMALNNFIYYFIFRHVTDKTILMKAAGWMELLVRSEPGNAAFMDTYANVLYKLGRRQEALAWQKRSLTLAPNDKEILLALSRMNANEPTWPVPDSAANK